MNVGVSIWLLGGFVLCGYAAIAKLGHVIKRRTKKTINAEPWRKYQPDPLDTSSRPENPKFATWDEAMNRPVTNDLRFMIEYADADGVITERVIKPLGIHQMAGGAIIYITAFCTTRNAIRTFRSDRILAAYNMQTNRKISDLGNYLRGRY